MPPRFLPLDRLARLVFAAVCLANSIESPSQCFGQPPDVSASPASPVANASRPLSLLRTVTGDIYRGSFASQSDGDHVAWRSPSFTQPISFPWSHVEAIETYSTDPLESAAANQFCAELQDGSMLSGQLVGLTSESLSLDIPGMGIKEIPITSVRNLLKLRPIGDGSMQTLASDAWEQILPATKNGRATKWFLKAGEIATETSGTTVSQWANLPELATIDLTVATNQRSPNFWLTLGEPRRMELQVRKPQNKKILNITLLLENTKDADVVTAQLPFEEGQVISLRLMCDATKGIYALMQGDKVLGRLKGNTTERFVGRTKVYFTNTALGLLTLRNLTISSSPFSIPNVSPRGPADSIEWMTRERGTFFGNVRGTTGPNAIEIVGANDISTNLNFDELERVEFNGKANDQEGAEPTVPAPLHLVEMSNGLRFASPAIRSVANADNASTSMGSAVLPMLGSEVRIPIALIRRIGQLNHEWKGTPLPASDSNAQREFRLVTDDVVSLGKIAAVVETPTGEKSFAWRPRAALESAALTPTMNGLIESIDAAPAVAQAEEKERTKRPGGMVLIRNDQNTAEVEVARALKDQDPNIFLRSGDCFPGQLLGGNESSVQFKTPLFTAQEIDASRMRGVRLVDYKGADTLDRSTRNRLLTLPRVQRKNPPKHLVVSRDGDLVRGNILSFTRDELTLEVRGEERTISMKNVAELIWLDTPTKEDASANGSAPATSDGSQESPTADSETNASVFQIVLSEGARVSVIPQSVDQNSLRGSHPQLGDCSLDWANIRSIFLGNTIRLDASRARYSKWKLQNAPDPKYMNEDESENDRPSDTPQMRLVGKPAPDFDIKRLDGTPCQLSDFEGKILILDFWASWCGPCIRSMPQWIEISRQYVDAGVEVVFINLEEDEERIRRFLEKMELNPTVAMDSDGSVSKQYAVQAIPQTVIIDREGVITEILVGASEENEKTLRNTLDRLTGRVSN